MPTLLYIELITCIKQNNHNPVITIGSFLEKVDSCEYIIHVI